jgi:hypothetical protein
MRQRARDVAAACSHATDHIGTGAGNQRAHGLSSNAGRADAHEPGMRMNRRRSRIAAASTTASIFVSEIRIAFDRLWKQFDRLSRIVDGRDSAAPWRL